MPEEKSLMGFWYNLKEANVQRRIIFIYCSAAYSISTPPIRIQNDW